MSIVSLLNVTVENNPAPFTSPYEFDITFECLEPLKDDLEWKLTYVGSSTSFEHDQELDSILVGPIPVGVNRFTFTADPPSPEKIPAAELVSVTVILLSCSYAGKEFVRVGYYVNNEYDSEELRNNPPSKVQIDKVVRNILAEKPRVTRFNIPWDNPANENAEFPPEQPEADLEDDEDDYAKDEDDEDDEEGGDDAENNEGNAEEEDGNDETADVEEAEDAEEDLEEELEDEEEEEEDDDEGDEEEDGEEDDADPGDGHGDAQQKDVSNETTTVSRDTVYESLEEPTPAPDQSSLADGDKSSQKRDIETVDDEQDKTKRAKNES